MEKIDRKTYLKLIKYSLNHLLDLSVSIYSLNTDAFIDQESGVIYKCYLFYFDSAKLHIIFDI